MVFKSSLSIVSQPFVYKTMFSLLKKLFCPSPLSTHFDVLEKLGSGGYGKVYLARRRQDDKKVALKKIKKNKIRDFVQSPVGDVPLEIYIAMMLSHPNIIRTSGFLKSGKSWCLVMDHCVGYMDLTSFIQMNKSISEQTARKIFIQTYKALTHCFKQNVVHRDVKADNILVHWSTHDVKLIDFGVSTFVHADTLIEDSRGTDIFMPPEFFLTHQYNPLRGTVWAMGCLLYCMVYGEVPFCNVHEVVTMTPTFRDITSSRGDISGQYCVDLLQRMLEPCEEERVTYKNISYHPWVTREKLY